MSKRKRDWIQFCCSALCSSASEDTVSSRFVYSKSYLPFAVPSFPVSLNSMWHLGDSGGLAFFIASTGRTGRSINNYSCLNQGLLNGTNPINEAYYAFIGLGRANEQALLSLLAVSFKACDFLRPAIHLPSCYANTLCFRNKNVAAVRAWISTVDCLLHHSPAGDVSAWITRNEWLLWLSATVSDTESILL